MKTLNKLIAATGILAAFGGIASAQTQYVTVTNFVTVTVTNVVTVTNMVPPAATPVAATTTGKTPAPAVPAKNPWQHAVTLGVSMTRGNSDSSMFTAVYEGQHKTAFDEYKVGLSASYGDQNGSQSVNNYKLFGQWNHLFSDRLFSYARVDGLRDIIAEVDYRASIGPGVGYYLVKNTNTTLAVEGGGAFEAERLDDTGDQTFATLRLAERFEHKVNDHVRIWQNVEIFPQVDKFDNYVVNFEAGVETALSKSFSLKTFVDDSYDNRPAPGKLKNDAKIIAALGYKF